MIRSIDVFRYRLPLVEEVRMGPVRSSWREGMCIRLSDGDVSGWGEAAPLPGFSRESLADVASELARLRSLLPARADDLLAVVSAPSARFAVDTAVREIAARDAQLQTLVDPSRARRSTLDLAALIDLQDEFDQDALLGRATLKMKVGADWHADLRRVEQVRQVLGPIVRLRIDANRRYTPKDAMAFLDGVRDLDVDFVEEPVLAGTHLPASPHVAVALDETLHDLASGFAGDGAALVRQARRLHPRASVLVVKPTLLGTWDFVRGLFGSARDAELRVVLSGAYESGIGMRASLALSAESPFDEAAGFDSYTRIECDLLRPPLDLSGPTIDLAEACSLARNVEEQALMKESADG